MVVTLGHCTNVCDERTDEMEYPGRRITPKLTVSLNQLDNKVVDYGAP